MKSVQLGDCAAQANGYASVRTIVQGLGAALLMAMVATGNSLGETRTKDTAATSKSQAARPDTLGFGSAELPVNVAEMREAILAAALSGDINELLIPIQWNELPPDFGQKPVKETLADWQKQSHDGSGREMLAVLANILSSHYAVSRQGPNIENAKIYIWPAFAELPLDKLSPPLEVALLRLVGVNDAKRMKQAGRYDGFGLAIGADGTWHAFKRVGNTETQANP